MSIRASFFSPIVQADGRKSRGRMWCFLAGFLALLGQAPFSLATPSVPVVSAIPLSDDGTYRVNWSPVSGAVAYNLKESTDNNSFTLISNTQPLFNQFIAKPNNTYWYIVRACSSFTDCSGWSAPVRVVVQRPPAPTLMRQTDNSQTGTYQVRWDAVANATSYKLEVSNNDVHFSPLNHNNPLIKFRVGIANGTYYYRVSSCIGFSCSPPSPSMRVIVQRPPNAPTGLKVNPATSTDGIYTVSWDPVSDHNVSYYLPKRKLNDGPGDGVLIPVPTNSISFSETNDDVYTYWAVAACATRSGWEVCGLGGGTSASVVVQQSASSTFFTDFPSGTVTGGNYRVAWLDSTQGASILSWKVEEQKAGESGVIRRGGKGQASLEYHPTNKPSGVYTYRYWVLVRACPTCDPEPYRPVGAPITVTVDNPYNPPVVSTSGHVHENQAGQGNFNISWEDTGAPVYKLEESVDGSLWSELDLISNTQTTGTTTTKFVLRSPGIYSYRVHGCTSGGDPCLVTSDTESNAVLAGTQVELSAWGTVDYQNNDALVKFSIKTNGAQSVRPAGSDYIEIQERIGSGGSWSSLTELAGSTWRVRKFDGVFGELIRGRTRETYQYRARACTGEAGLPGPGSHPPAGSICQSTWSTTQTVTIGSYVAFNGDTDVKARANVEHTISYHMPIGFPSDRLQLKEKRNDESVLQWNQIDLQPNPQVPFVDYEKKITRPAGHYNYQVTAFLSDTPTKVVKSKKQNVEFIALPNAPSGVLASYDPGTQEMKVTWNSPVGGGVVEGYDVTILRVGSTPQTHSHSNTDTSRSRVITGLVQGDYTFSVKACNTANTRGCSPPSASSNLVPVNGLGTPVLTVAQDASGYTLSWNSVVGASSSTLYYVLERSVPGAYPPSGSPYAPVAQGSSLQMVFPNPTEGYRGYRVVACDGTSPCGDNSNEVLVEVGVVSSQLNPPSDIYHQLTPTGFTLFWQADPSAEKFVVNDVTGGNISNQYIGANKSWAASSTNYPSGIHEFEITACDDDNNFCSAPATYTVDLDAQPWAQRGAVHVPNQPYAERFGPQHDSTVGALAGQGGVSGGQASYQIPITVVPGRNKMQPEVAISYSSRGGNGALGMGWSLSAGSAITRCARTVAVDGINGGVTLNDSTDRLCLDGQRLIKTQGTYGVSNTVYRLELDDFTRVTQHGALSDTGTSGWFEVELKNGRVREYGHTADSKQMPAGNTTPANNQPAYVPKPVSWAINAEQDRSGNSMQYEYIYGPANSRSGADSNLGEGEHLLKTITYTGTNGSGGTRSVDFDYGARVQDWSSRFIGGGRIRQTQQLNSITTKYQSQAVREYELKYKVSGATSRRLLTSVQECGFDDSSRVCKPATSMTWLDDEADYVLEQVGYRNSTPDNYVELVDDPSLVPQYAFATDDGDLSFFDISQVIPHGDVNGDGAPDWPAIYHAGNKVRDGWFSDAEGGKRAVNTKELMTCARARGRAALRCIDADFNQDGKTDSWRMTTDDTPEFQIRYTDGSGDWIDTSIDLPDRDDTVVAIADYNGDGWPDVMTEKYSTLTGSGSSSGNTNEKQLWLWLHSGNPGTPYPANKGQQAGQPTYPIPKFETGSYTRKGVMHVGDMDGNGLPDMIVTKINNADAAGSTFYPLEQPVPEALLLTQEPDGSGPVTWNLVDLPAVSASFEAGGHSAYYSSFMDVNGDGLLDLLAWNDHSGGLSKKLKLLLNMGNGVFAKDWDDLGDASRLERKERFLPGGSPTEPASHYSHYAEGAHAIRQFDYDSDGRADLLIPTGIEVPVCASRKQLQASGVITTISSCGTFIGAPYQQLNGNYKTVAQLDEALWDDNLYNYQVMRFVESATGDFTAVLETTELVGAGVHSAGTDATGNGLTDLVFSYGCRKSGDIFGADGLNIPTNVCEVSNGSLSSDNAMHNKPLGVYMWRNRGAAPAVDASNPAPERYQPIDMLASVENGLDVQDSWFYRPLSSQDSRYSSVAPNLNLPLYSPDFDYLAGLNATSRRAHFHFGSSMYVVAQHTVSDGIGGDNESQYRYKGAIYNREGRGFQGFRSVIHEDISAGLQSRSDFYQVFPVAGKLDVTRTWGIDDVVSDTTADAVQAISKSKHEWTVYWDHESTTPENRTIADPNEPWTFLVNEPLFVAESKVTKTNRNLGLAPNNTRLFTHLTLKSDSFSNWGNLESTLNIYAEAGFDHEVKSSTAYTYYPPVIADWWLNRTENVVTLHSAIVDRLGVAGADSDSQTVTNYVYDPSHRLPEKITVFDGSGTNPVAAGLISEFEYTSFGLPELEEHSEPGFPAVVRKNTIFYNPDGYFPETVTNAEDHVTTYGYDSRFGLPDHVIDANGVESGTQFDAFGRVVVVTSDLAPAQRTSLQLCESCVPNAAFKATQTQTGSPQRTTYFDQLGREMGSDSEGFPNLIKTRMSYDNLGRVTFESAPSESNDFAKGTRYEAYDVLGRLTRKAVDQRDGAVLVTTYDHDQGARGFTTEINAGGYTMSRSYNGLGQLYETKDADPNHNSTKYAYDGRGNPVTLQNSKGNNITAAYDAFNRKISVTDPDMGTKLFQYNGFGELKLEIDGRGSSISTSYDLLGRATGRISGGGGVPLQLTQWVYDTALLDGGSAYVEGQLHKEVSVNGPETIVKILSYDALARPNSVVTAIGDSTPPNTLNFFITGYQYDSNFGRLKGLLYPGNLTVGYRYSDTGYKTETFNANSGYRYRQVNEASARGQWESADMAGGLYRATRVFDAATGWSTSGDLERSSDSATLHHQDYDQHDVFGNLTIMTTDVPGQNNIQEDYIYDKLHRLKKNTVIGNGFNSTIDYTYDTVGNLTSKSDYATGYEINPDNNQVETVTLVDGNIDKTFDYDLNGNLTTENGVVRTSYNAFNKPIHITRPNTSGVVQGTTIAYGGDLMRYRKTTGSGKKTLYVDKLYERIESATEVQDRVYIDDIAVLTYTTGAPLDPNAPMVPEIAFSHKDRLGSTVALVDHLGVLKETHSFDPFGKPRQGSGEGKSPVELDSDFSTRGFTDHEHMDEIQMIHMNGRGYDYNLGRFLSVDPFIEDPGNSQGMNPYSYIMNNPLSGTDPTGYCIGTRICNGDGTNKSGVLAVKSSPGGGGGSGKAARDAKAAQNNGGNKGKTGGGTVPSAGNDDTGASTGPNETAQKKQSMPIETPEDETAGANDTHLRSDPIDSEESVRTARLPVEKEESLGFKTNTDGDLILCVGADACGASSNTANATTGQLVSEGVALTPWGRVLRYFRVGKFAGGLCFVEGTLVRTKGGLKPIEQIQIGDLVAAKNDVTGEVTWKPVIDLFRNDDKRVVWITLVDSQGNEDIIGATLEHPFWVEGRGWIEASKLNYRDKVVSFTDHKVLRVVQVDFDATKHITYNFEVQGVHTYFVGEHGAWVHNASKITSPNQLNQQIQRGAAPRGFERVDVGKVTGEQPHIHFKNGSALNFDGTWKHGRTKLTKKQTDWIQQNGWNLPE